MMQPSGTDPAGDQSFSMIPTRLLGIRRTNPVSTVATARPTRRKKAQATIITPVESPESELAALAWAKRGDNRSTTADVMKVLLWEIGMAETEGHRDYA